MSTTQTAAAAPRSPLQFLLTAISGEFWRYLAASLVSLGLDFGLLWLLTARVGLHYLASAAIGYGAGCILHYGLSITLVFRERRLTDRRMEFIGFFATGLLGLAANELMLKAAVDVAGVGYLVGKVAATGGSFVLTFVARRAALFSIGRRSAS